jgi:muramoyltetrapeptide carboxypeptidase
MTFPPFLESTDKITVVAPAKAVNVAEIKNGILEMEKLGLHVNQGKHLFQKFNQFAGSDEQRTEDFQAAIDNPEIKAIFCARGGYGSMRIINKIDFSSLANNPKWIVGFSDITVFHNHLHNINIASLHAAMPLSFGKKPELISEILAILSNKKYQYNISASALNRKGKTRGKLVGGNLTLLSNLIGTKYDIDTRDKILLLEDVGENLYKIDRMMMHLKLSGKLENLKALVVGTFNLTEDNDIPFGKNAYEIVREKVEEYHYPVMFNVPAGHDLNNKPFVLGAEHELEVSDKVCLITSL